MHAEQRVPGGPVGFPSLPRGRTLAPGVRLLVAGEQDGAAAAARSPTGPVVPFENAKREIEPEHPWSER